MNTKIALTMLAALFALEVYLTKKEIEHQKKVQVECDKMLEEFIWKVNHKTPMIIYL